MGFVQHQCAACSVVDLVRRVLLASCSVAFFALGAPAIAQTSPPVSGPIPYSKLDQPLGPAARDAAGRVPSMNVVNVKDAKWAGGAKGDGATDDTAALQAAANAVPASGGVLEFPAGQYAVAGIASASTYGTTYVGVRIHSNTTVKCDGATLVGIGANASNLNILVNAGFQLGTTISDTNIKVQGCGFLLPITSGASITFWFASHVAATDNVISGGGDGIQTVGVMDGEISRNRVIGNGNAGSDNYWGSSQLRITNNYFAPAGAPEGANGNAWGVQLTNTDIANNNVTMDDELIEGNTIYYSGTTLNTGAPIGIDGTVTGLINHLTISHNHLFNTGTNNGNPGIFLISAGGSWNITDNTLDGSKQIPAIYGESGNQRDVVVSGNLLSNCAFTTGAPGYYLGNIMLQGQRNTVTNNRQLTTCTGAMVSLGGTENVSLGNDDGSGRVPMSVAGLSSDASGNFTAAGRFISTNLSALLRATSGASQAFSATKTQVLYPTAYLDDQGNYANSTFTCLTTGYYDIDAQIEQNGTGATSGDQWAISIDKAGSATETSIRDQVVTANQASALVIRDVLLLNAGDTVKINVVRVAGTGTLASVADGSRGHFIVHQLQ